jgi:hypothetical protein
VKFLFKNPTEACLHMLTLQNPPDRKLEIDRINNNLGYQEGNMRFCTRRENQANRRNTRIPYFRQEDWPYFHNVVRRKVKQGLTREQILADARKAVVEKRKNWRGIAARLKSMTSSTAGPETGL